MRPQRIQRKRTAGWRMPEGAVYVGRPSKWGNPFRAGAFRFLTGPKAGQKMDAADAVKAFRNRINLVEGEEVIARIRKELAGKDLVCWCPLDAPCHADVLLEIANRDDGVGACGVAAPTPSTHHPIPPKARCES
jgi:hypothetical protein